MAYINNGKARSLKVSITKKVGGNTAQGYPKTYDGQQAFPGYASLSDTEFAQLGDAAFTTREAAFEAYVESIEGGLEFDTDVVGNGSIIDQASCIATTTTTTIAQVVTTTLAPVVTTTTTAAVPKMRVDYTSSDSQYQGGVADASALPIIKFGRGGTGISATTYSASVSQVNLGTADLIITDVRELEDVNGLFSATVPSLPYTAAPSYLNGFTIEFNTGVVSVSPGTYRAVYQITSNDPTYPTFDLEFYIEIA